MNIMYHSAAPWIATGYGRCTEEIATRLHNTDHNIQIQPMNAIQEGPIWYHGENIKPELEEPMKVWGNGQTPFGLGVVEENMNKANSDLLFTHFDTWMKRARNIIPDIDYPYISYVIVDHEPVPAQVIEQVKNAVDTVAMSKWGQMQLKQAGVDATYMPHGVDTDSFYPIGDDEMNEVQVEIEDKDTGDTRIINVNDEFIIGMVAANHGDRKRIPQHLDAFKQFIDKVDEDALMYIHTEANAKQGYNLTEVAERMNIPSKNLIWADQETYGEVGDEFLNTWYNAFDVLVNCSMGESWGLTITESMAAGTPVIVNNFSSMPEQLGVKPDQPSEYIKWLYNPDNGKGGVGEAPHGVVVNPSVKVYREKVSSRQAIVHAHDIFKALEYYYNNPHIRDTHGEMARDYVCQNYDWEETILPKWESYFNTIEEAIL